MKARATPVGVPTHSPRLPDFSKFQPISNNSGSAGASITRLSGVPDTSGSDANMMQGSCAYFAAMVLTGPREAPYNGKFVAARHHSAWDQLVQHHRRLCVLASRDHGKCLIPDALILSASGERVRADSWPGGELLAYDPQTHALVRAYSPPSEPNGVKETFTVRTRTGREITATGNHPLRLIDRWLDVSDLQVGHRIAVTTRELDLSLSRWPGNEVVFWDEVVSIEPAGLQETWAIHVPGLENFVANDIVNHNSYFFNFAFPIWKAIHMPGASGMIFSATQPQAEHILDKIKTEIETNPRLKHLIPAKKNQWSARSIRLSNGHRIYARGFGTKVRGAHPEWCVVDDGLNDESMYSETVRKKQIDYFFSAITNMVVPGGQLLVVGCVAPDTWIATEHGLRQIGSLCPGPRTPKTLYNFDLGVHGLKAGQRANKFWVQGTVATRTITTRFGYRVEGSLRHPVLVMGTDGVPMWVRFQDIEVGQYVGVKIGTEAWGSPTPVAAQAHGIPDYLERVPTEVMGGARDTAVEFLCGLSGGHSLSDLTAGHVVVSTGYPDLAHDVQVLLCNLGVVAVLGEQVDRDDPDVKTYTVKLLSNTEYEADADGIVWLPVTEIAEGYGEVMDFVIDGDHSFVTNGIVSHNTPFHAADLYSVLAENTEYKFQTFSAINPDGTALWPARYDTARLEAKQREIGSLRFAREFECKAVSDSMSLFPRHLFEGDPTEQMLVKLGMPLEFWKQLGVQIFMGVDFALSSSVQADYFVVWVMGKDKAGNRWVVDIHREKGLPYHRQLSLINSMAQRYSPGLIFLESNQMQRIFGDELIRKTDLPIKKFTTSAHEKNSLEKGVPGLRTLLENGKIRIPRGDKRSVELTDIWKAEMQAFTWVDGKLQGLGAHDDSVMAFWICNQAINQGGFEFSFSDDGVMDDQDPDLLRQLTGMSQEELSGKMNPTDTAKEAPIVLDAETRAVLDAMAKGRGTAPTATAPPRSTVSLVDPTP